MLPKKAGSVVGLSLGPCAVKIGAKNVFSFSAATCSSRSAPLASRVPGSQDGFGRLPAWAAQARVCVLCWLPPGELAARLERASFCHELLLLGRSALAEGLFLFYLGCGYRVCF